MAEAKSGRRAIIPGDVAGSELIRRISTKDGEDRMPPADHGPALNEAEVGRLQAWIRGGANWSKHWAYEPPVRPPLPQTKDTDWPRNGIDQFILARLEAERLQPSIEASRLEWLRRASLDLTGLPPSTAEIGQFLADASPEAYEHAADRLLASPSYGERWTSNWLDLARYADTMGYERDGNRVVWPWRDWVIRALNADLPYDEFVLRQLAGDLLPGASDDDRLATAFHRNTQTNMECGTDDEEYRTLAVIDRVATTWEGLLGTSFRCVQCHSHPYDPFKQEDFYRFAALFNTTADHDANEDFPLMRVAVKESDRTRLSQAEEQIRSLRHALHSEGMALADRTAWTFLPLEKGSATGQASLSQRTSPGDGVPEVITTGTIAVNSVFTLDFPIGEDRALTALRIQALPMDESRSLSFPELGFVLSHIRVQVVRPSGETNDITLATAFDDNPEAFFPAERSLDPDAAGWSAYPLFHRRRTAVFIPAAPVLVGRGSVIRCILTQTVQSSGITAQTLRRSRFAMSGERGWTDLLQAQAERRKAVESEQQLAKGIPAVYVPVMAEQPANQRRETRLFHRGNWRDKGSLVDPGIPAVLGGGDVRNRLDLARWMTAPANPLFARVAVNRLWEQLFGAGLVASVGEFGSTGESPSHPELLDWLAVRFSTDLGYHAKALLREIVLSATYRQSASSTSTLIDRDPQNRLLARGPRQRLTAEMVRDQALAVSGLLSSKLGGPPVMPSQPEGIWRTVYNGGRWTTSPGEDAHRRSVYTFIRRTSGYPSYQTFDAPSREYCTVRRLPTNTPLQALVTLNDPVYMEAARALALRMEAGGTDIPEQVAAGWQFALGRPAPPVELETLVDLCRQAQVKFAANPKAAAAVAGSPQLAALTVTANAILNLDVVLTR